MRADRRKPISSRLHFALACVEDAILSEMEADVRSQLISAAVPVDTIHADRERYSVADIGTGWRLANEAHGRIKLRSDNLVAELTVRYDAVLGHVLEPSAEFSKAWT